MPRKVKFLFGGLGLSLLALYFFWWFIQTAWLGSFPGRDISYFAFWAYTQLGVSVICLAAAIWCFVRALRAVPQR